MKAVALVLLVACDGDATDDKFRPDAPTGETPQHECFGTGLVNVCFFGEPRGPVNLSGTLATSDPARCTLSREDCVILGTTIRVANLDVSGPRALILVADKTIVVDGVLDASSTRAGKTGPNASPPLCTLPQNASQQAGGAGGTFGGRGGQGAAGLGAPTPPGLVVPVTQFHGGCPGGRADGAPTPFVAAGGGAVFLIAREAITINGAINASGAGGAAGQVNGGGGGGGSGGMIGLDAPRITITGSVFANGGGGGEGGAGAAPGLDASDPTLPAAGGASGAGGDGGAGGAGTMADGAPGAPSGGGGGGGVGVVMLIPPQPTGGTVSPPPQI